MAEWWHQESVDKVGRSVSRQGRLLDLPTLSGFPNDAHAWSALRCLMRLCFKHHHR